MNNFRTLIRCLLLALLPGWVQAQNPESSDVLAQELRLVEGSQRETGGTSLILDNSRTKVGRDFYDLFYKYWSALPLAQADVTQQPDSIPSAPLGNVVILVEEIPSPGTANQILISIGDQPVWHQFVQARYDALEADALEAVEAVRQFIASAQETQQLLGTQDQQESGIF